MTKPTATKTNRNEPRNEQLQLPNIWHYKKNIAETRQPTQQTMLGKPDIQMSKNETRPLFLTLPKSIQNRIKDLPILIKAMDSLKND